MYSNSSVKTFSILDALVILALLGAALIAIPALTTQKPAIVVTLYNNAVIARYPLNENRTYRITGTLGPMDIAISNGTARVGYSTCPQQVCVHTGSISKTGQQIVCAPNHIIIEIHAAGKDTIDAVTQ